MLIALSYLVRSTRQGKAMRAVAQDMDASRMMGIDVDRTIAFTFALGGALAGAAGLLFVMYQTSTRYDLGFQLGLFAFTAAVLGGIGNLTGAALGRNPDRPHPGVQRGPLVAHAGIELDAVSDLLDPDPRARVPAAGTPR